jgi:hypothetical protein
MAGRHRRVVAPSVWRKVPYYILIVVLWGGVVVFGVLDLIALVHKLIYG